MKSLRQILVDVKIRRHLLQERQMDGALLGFHKQDECNLRGAATSLAGRIARAGHVERTLVQLLTTIDVGSAYSSLLLRAGEGNLSGYGGTTGKIKLILNNRANYLTMSGY